MERMERFDICLAQVLTFETGYKQPPGGPFVRFRPSKKHPVSPLETGKPDGMAFDDDPNDTGGRTSMGILQREYSAWRQSMSLPARDVWLIEDRELSAIYKRQYWAVCRCDELPAGIDMQVFDAAVTSGVGTAGRLLQRALGLNVDGHIGQVTLASAHAVADAAALVAAFAAEHEKYYRACRTFKHHGNGWLKRKAACATVALAMLQTMPQAWPAAEVEVDFAEHSRRAAAPPVAASVAETATAQRETFQGAAGGGLVLTKGMEIYGQAQQLGILESIAKNPAAAVIILLGIGLMLNAQFGFADRARKLILGV